MFATSKIKVGSRALAFACALAASSFSAHAVLERVGPVSASPSGGGYPAWYQDTTGIALEFCSPQNQSELGGGWCLLLAGDLRATPEVFPTNFFDEHFYFAGTAVMSHQSGAHSLLVLAEEGAFAVGPVVPGDQITFSRIRVKLDPVPVTGTYRFIHPYGEEIIHGEAGGRIFFTDDVGIGSPGDFSGALRSRMGPFLLPSATPGGAEMPPVTAANPTPDTDPTHFGGAFTPTPYPGTGAAYIADPSRIGPVTGSNLPNFIDSTGASRNHNIFRIEGPAGSALGVDPATGAIVDWAETTDFSLMGRLFTGTMPGHVENARASYTRNASGQKLDVLAIGNPATASRLPTAPPAGKIVPTVTFFDQPCTGTVDAFGTVRPPYGAPLGATESQMFASGNMYWGQARPAVLPSSVCIKNGNARDVFGNIAPAYLSQPVTDEVTVTQALYDSSAGTLTVAATSSDATVPPALRLAYGNVLANLSGGQVVVPNVSAPPSTVSVLSSALGVTEYAVATSYPGGVAATAPVATADSYNFAEDSGAHILAVLANDVNAAGGTVTLTSAPTLGTAVANPDGTVTYTSNLNANGADSFTYTVTVGAQVSATATVSLNIVPVNDAPVAVNDTATVVVNTPIQIDVLGNDTDPDGKADLANAVSISASSPAGATITGGAGGIVSFIAAQAGTYTFTYRAQDSLGVSSANTGRVTVTVTAPFTVAINRNQYTRSTRNLLVEGVTSDPGTPTVTVKFVDNAGTVLGTGGSVAASGGKWKLSATVSLPIGATGIVATLPSGALSGAAALTIK